MDLREKISLAQRAAEYSIRFRLLETLLMVALCAVALYNIDGVSVSILPLSQQAEGVIFAFIHGDFRILTANYGIVFAILALFLFRWKFFGFKCGLLLFFFLLFSALFLLVVAEYKDTMQILIACIFIIALTGFFFIRSLFVKSIFPVIFLAYAFSAWLLFLGVSNLAWFGLISIFFADIFHMILGLRHHISENAKKKKTLEGAITHIARKSIPVSFLSFCLLIILEIIFHFMKLPMLASENLLVSFIAYICYILWMPFFTAAILSFCPLKNTCEKIQKKFR